MPKTKRKRSAPHRETPDTVDGATVRLLLELLSLDRRDKFRLAAVVMWIRGVWAGDSTVLADTHGAFETICAMTERERTQAVEMAADSNLRAAVTS